MGTSMSGKGPNGSNPLVPPWAEDGDNLAVIGGGEEGEDFEASNSDVQDNTPIPPNQIQWPTRFQAARRAFSNYAKTGSRDDLKKALGHYARNSTGRGSGATKRLASGITAGTGLYGLLSGNTVNTNSGSLTLSNLSGLTTDQAIDKIVTHLSPDSADFDVVRTSLNYSLSEALQEIENIDDVEFTPELIGEVFTYYISDLVFQQVLLDMGKSWLHAETPIRQIYMENELSELIKVVVDRTLEEISGGDVSSISQSQIMKVQISAISQTISEWEKY